MPRKERRMRLTSLMGFLADDLAVDLGTANTLVYVRGHGIVLNEPSIVAMKDGTVLAAGHEAKAMLGRAPGSISVVRPLRHGVIADFDSTEKMLHYFIAKTRQRKTDRKSTRLNSSHPSISYAVFCLKKK